MQTIHRIVYGRCFLPLIRCSGEIDGFSFMGQTFTLSCTTDNRTIKTSGMTTLLAEVPPMHYKCRNSKYPRFDPGEEPKVRSHVSDSQVLWSVPWPEYEPINYTMKFILAGTVFTDPQDLCHKRPGPKWFDMDGIINRRSYMGKYDIIKGVPRNPVGRTGMAERGTLGRWGPNHAADPIVTRWKMDDSGKIAKSQNGAPILQFISILRKKDYVWAIPGGMVDAGEAVPLTLRREFSEEALNLLAASKEEKSRIMKSVADLFRGGEVVYKGYSDDPRNTDNCWIETIAVNFHDEDGSSVGKFKLHAGDDAVGVRWIDISEQLALFASHVNFLNTVAIRHNAHW